MAQFIIFAWLVGILVVRHVFGESKYVMAAGVLWPVAFLPFISSFRNFLYKQSVVKEQIISGLLFMSFAVILVGSSTSIDPTTSGAFVAIASFVFFFSITSWSLGEDKVSRALAWFALVGLACLGAILGSRLIGGGRLGVVYNPNALAVIAWGMGLVAYYFPQAIIRYSLMAFAGFIVYRTGSRTGMLAYVVGIGSLLYWLAIDKRGGKLVKREHERWGIALFILCVLGVLYFKWERVSEIFWDFVQFDSKYRGVSTGATGRTIAWRDAIELWQCRPWLGIGMRLHEGYFNGLYRIRGFEGSLASSSHSGYFMALAEFGIFGFLSLISIIGLRLWNLGKQALAGNFHARVAFSFLLAYLTEALLERYFINVGNTTSTIFILFLCMPVVRRDKQKNRKSEYDNHLLHAQSRMLRS